MSTSKAKRHGIPVVVSFSLIFPLFNVVYGVLLKHTEPAHWIARQMLVLASLILTAVAVVCITAGVSLFVSVCRHYVDPRRHRGERRYGWQVRKD